MGTTEQIARFIVETRYAGIPAEAVRLAKDAILDGLGVTLAGSIETAGKIITQYVREVGGASQAGVIGGGFKTSAPQAALANGTMAHALDYDDVLWLMGGHPTVPVLPVVLALGEMYHCSGRDVLEAYIVGVEVEARIGSGIGSRHYAVGWHSTATLGTLGATAAAARMLGLSVPETRMALGIAASEAGGLRQNFGTMTKPFHAGNAARNGLVAAMLAQKGFTADENILENPFGFCFVLGGEGEYSLEMMTKSLGDPFAVVNPGLDMKPYPCCRITHRCIDAILHIIEEYHPAVAEVAGVECQTSLDSPQVLIHHQPRTALEGKFSMEYCMARALLDGEIQMAQFTEEKVLDPRAQELLQRVKYVHAESVEGRLLPEVVTVRLRDGRQHSHEVLIAKGAPENPLTTEELMAKYRDCACLVFPLEATERSLELVSHLEEIKDIAELADLLTSKGEPSGC
ncbi:MmgE/PrpD family protein [Chloroflexota bacterium]